ncbi:endonuclease/exonuclease/phosphatase family protein [Mycolicibacterium sp. CBM1]
MLIAAAALAARFVSVTNHAVLALTAWSPYLMLAAGISTLFAVLTRRWRAASAALTLTAAVVAAELPLFLGDDQAGAGAVAVRVLTANLREGQADMAALTTIAEDQADLLIVQELTPRAVGILTRSGLDSEFRYRALDTQPHDPGGVGIWSRYPVVRWSRVHGYALGVIKAAIRIPEAAADTMVLAAHVVGPWPQPISGWREELAAFPATMNQAAAEAGLGAVIVAGDFNATFDMKNYRALLQNGFRDVAEQSGAGLTPSFRADGSLPPLIGIDHIVTHTSSASAARTVRVPGSDHLGLVATVHVPR